MTGELAVLDASGDTKTVWNSENADEVAIARETFTKLKAKGFGLFHVKKDGEAGKRMTEFDPEVERMIAIPQLVGG